MVVLQSFAMETSKKQDVFSLSDSNESRIDFKQRKFRLFTHVVHENVDIKPIKLDKKDMLKLCNHLEPMQESASDIDQGDEADKTPDGDVKSFVISKSGRFETRLILNVYDSKPIIWLRLFLDIDYQKPDKKAKRSKKYVEKFHPCKGGIILSDVDVDELKNFCQQF